MSNVIVSSARNLISAVYTNNPFYCISALLILIGIRSMVQTDDGRIDPALLAAMLGVYTIAMGATSVLVVRLGKVWEDARTILMTFVLLVVASSISFDEIVLTNLRQGQIILVAGLVVAVTSSELLRYLLDIRVSLSFRIAYHLFLAVFYLYPLLLKASIGPSGSQYVLVAIALFSTVIAAILILLLPAASRGPNRVHAGAAPWNWPSFPWSVFVLLGAVACWRTYSLTIAYFPIKGMDSAFGFYLIVPILLAGSLLLFEVTKVSNNKISEVLACLIPVVTVLWSVGNTELTKAQARLSLFITDSIAAPLFLVVVACLATYLYLLARRCRGAEYGFMLCLASFTIISPEHINLVRMVEANPYPLLIISGTQLLVFTFNRDTTRLFVSVAALIAASGIYFQDSWYTETNWIIPIHLAYCVAIVVALKSSGTMAKIISHFVAVSGVLVGLWELVASDGLPYRESLANPLFYFACIGVVSFTMWIERKELAHLLAAILNSTCGFMIFGQMSYEHLFVYLGRARPLFLWSLICFVVALVVSLHKSGHVRLWRQPSPPSDTEP